ncbi:MAG: hypothetical protein J3R72DRAFT_500063 [Linnemannia gamsii]|nr:MAG: hypothetical protein J3R72DRAFT_500063 [Linnemannia gamsii]
MAELHSLEQKPGPELEIDPLHLTEDQLKAFNCIKDRIENISNSSISCQMLITGAAGTGKSTLLKIVASINDFRLASEYHGGNTLHLYGK